MVKCVEFHIRVQYTQEILQLNAKTDSKNRPNMNPSEKPAVKKRRLGHAEDGPITATSFIESISPDLVLLYIRHSNSPKWILVQSCIQSFLNCHNRIKIHSIYDHTSQMGAKFTKL
ncbi:hypothetical protein ILUMI_07597 [Ignelater luminosus]|uniref:Uncharacterized protein n=1 Tax=Ignelater luminosus TaxID=2038154 RepID=A0A8K0D8I0_IGNLU|nr:hypothetical protein ILUMI_07597 [Ignelater luminosus]